MGKASWRLTNISALQRIKHKKGHQSKKRLVVLPTYDVSSVTAWLCFWLFCVPVRTPYLEYVQKNPISRRQLVPHLQWNRPMNCYFILRPQFGQIRLLALIKVYWSLAIISSADIPLASSFFNTDSASAFLDSSAAFFFGSNLFCLCFRKFLCCNLQSRFFTFQLFLQCANVVRQCGNLGFNRK